MADLEDNAVENKPDEVVVDDPRFELLPTGKQHISYSELSEWFQCGWRHKLRYVDKVGEDLPGVHADFGTAMHAAGEHFLRTRLVDQKLFMTKLHELWKENGPLVPEEYTVDAFREFAADGKAILPELPAWFDRNFVDWEFIDAEHFLYEPASPTQPHAFKGYIDAIIKATGKKGQKLVWLLDFKTCKQGWHPLKKRDANVARQLVLYKNYWASKVGADIKDVRCAFILLKRKAKPGRHIELFSISVGEVTLKKSLKVVDNMLHSIKKGIALKNKDNCKFCIYKETEWCP